MDNYFSKNNDGGSAASRGFEYQDMCAILYFFENIDDGNFLSLTLEQINDFSVLFKSKEERFQVKNYKLNKGEINNILTQSQDCDNVHIVAPVWNLDIAKIIRRKNEYNNAILAKRSNVQIKYIKEQLNTIIEQKGYHSNALKCSFEIITQDNLENAILYKICLWGRKHGFDLDEEVMLSHLIRKVQNKRGDRGSLNYSDLESIVQKSIKISRISAPPKFLNTQKINIIKSLSNFANERKHLSDLINLVIAYIEYDEYGLALEKIEELVVEMKEAEIYRAWIFLQLQDFDNVQKICNKVIENGITNDCASAYFYKSVVNFHRKKYNKAYKYIEHSIKLCNDITYEQAYYLAKIEIRINKSLDEAKKLLRQCIELKDDNSEVYYELARVSNSYEAIELLKKSIAYDGKNFAAVLLLAENYRIVGYDAFAYEQYIKYFSDFDNLSNWKALQGMVHCLINLGKIDEAELYLVQFINRFVNSEKNKIKDHQTAIIMDLTWNDMKILTCTKENNCYIFDSPLGRYRIPERSDCSSMKNKDGLGVAIDSLAYREEVLTCELFGKELDLQNVLKPVMVANYDDDYLYLTKKHYLMENNMSILNCDFIETINDAEFCKLFYKLTNGEDLHYLEFVSDEKHIKVNIFEYVDRIQVETVYSNNYKHVSTFIKGKGYHEFRKALQKNKRLSWYFYSVNRKELIDLCIPATSVNIICC